MLVAYGISDFLFLFVDKGSGRPGAAASANVDDIIFEDLFAILGMHHLGMELNAVMRFVRVFYRGNGRIVRVRNCGIAIGERRNVVSVTHPDDRSGGHAGQEIRIVVYDQGGTSKFTSFGLFNRGAKGIGKRL